MHIRAPEVPGLEIPPAPLFSTNVNEADEDPHHRKQIKRTPRAEVSWTGLGGRGGLPFNSAWKQARGVSWPHCTSENGNCPNRFTCATSKERPINTSMSRHQDRQGIRRMALFGAAHRGSDLELPR